MTPEQKQYALDLVSSWTTARNQAAGTYVADKLAALLQELVDAPEPEPFGYFKAEPFGWTDCAETDDGAIPLYTTPPAPSVPDGQLQAAFDRGLKAGNDQSIAQQVEIHKLHDLLAGASAGGAAADVARDAARYRFLRDTEEDSPQWERLCVILELPTNEWDALIDAAMSEKGDA